MRKFARSTNVVKTRWPNRSSRSLYPRNRRNRYKSRILCHATIIELYKKEINLVYYIYFLYSNYKRVRCHLLVLSRCIYISLALRRPSEWSTFQREAAIQSLAALPRGVARRASLRVIGAKTRRRRDPGAERTRSVQEHYQGGLLPRSCDPWHRSSVWDRPGGCVRTGDLATGLGQSSWRP